MILSASDLYSLYRPSECELRVWLRHRGEAEAGPTEFEELLRELGANQESKYLATMDDVTDLSRGASEERKFATLEAIRAGKRVLYQPVFTVRVPIQGDECQVDGVPDFLIREGGGYVVRDCKLSRHADEERHYETVLQLGLYGFLYEQSAGCRPLRLEVVLGDGGVQPIQYDGGKAALAAIERVFRIRSREAEFYEPVGWSKCSNCGFIGRCWPRAEESDDPSRVYGIDQNLARHLHACGVATVASLLSGFDERSLSEIKVQRGAKFSRVGLKAKDAIIHARVLAAGQPEVMSKPVLPSGKNFVVFDIEGLPPWMDELERVYLWGIWVLGERPSEYLGAAAHFGPDGDRRCWSDFLANCGQVFDRYGDLAFLHWTSYERTYLRRYAARYGDHDGTGARVERNLLDLFPVAKSALILPEPTYSLKVVEKYAGFERRLEERNGQWAMATYIRAVESADPLLWEELIGRIIEYNREDLESTWAVFQWLRTL